MVGELRSSLDYLQFVRQFEIEPDMIQAPAIDWGLVAIAWLDQLNQRFYAQLVACQDCFHPANRVAVQIYVAPINPRFQADAFCNLQQSVATIVVDPSRIAPSDWLAVVAHEYAHVVGGAGHGPRYARMLGHLCLGLGLGDPGANLGLMSEADLQSYPPCRSLPPAADFWWGMTERHCPAPSKFSEKR